MNSQCDTIPRKFFTGTVGKKRTIATTPKVKLQMELGKRTQEEFNKLKKLLTEEPCLADYAKDRENIVTTDPSKTGQGKTLWQKQSDGAVNPIAFGSRYLKKSREQFIGGLDLLAVVWV